MEDGYVVYYTGVQADFARGNMLYATGQSLDALEKQGVALASSKTMGNTKEATVGRTADGHWRLWYEYAAANASRVGLAIGPGVSRPWDGQQPQFLPRPTSWANSTSSNGPVLMNHPNKPAQIYNAAT